MMKNVLQIIVIGIVCYGCSAGYQEALKQEFESGYKGEYSDKERIVGFYEYNSGMIEIMSDGTFILNHKPAENEDFMLQSSWSLDSSPKLMSLSDEKGMALCLDADLKEIRTFFGDESCFRYQLLDDKLVIEVYIDGETQERELLKKN